MSDEEPDGNLLSSEILQTLIEQISDAPTTQQNEILSLIALNAQASSGDSEAWNALALGLFHAKRFDEAAEIFDKLVNAFPDTDIYRLSLATTYTQMGQFDRCKVHLTWLRSR